LFSIVGLLIHLVEYVINQQFLVKDFSSCIIIIIIIIIIIVIVVVVVVVVVVFVVVVAEAFKECSTLGVTNREFS
jgi:flagellar basal body-associated protein FliL